MLLFGWLIDDFKWDLNSFIDLLILNLLEFVVVVGVVATNLCGGGDNDWDWDDDDDDDEDDDDDNKSVSDLLSFFFCCCLFSFDFSLPKTSNNRLYWSTNSWLLLLFPYDEALFYYRKKKQK